MNKAALDSTEDFGKALLLMIFGAAIIVFGFRRFRLLRKIKDMGSIPIASSPQGFVELQGFAWQTVPVISPVSRRECVFYSIEIQEYERYPDGRRWVTVAVGQSDVPFVLADSTGHVLVHGKDADLEIHGSKELTKDWMTLISSQQQALLQIARKERRSFSDRFLFLRKKLRVKEKIILPGSPLYALGSLRKSAATSKFYRAREGLQVFMSRVANLNHAALDTNRDGKISFEEWRNGYLASATLATGSGAPVVIPAGRRVESRCYGELKTSPSHKLFLADCHQAELLKKLAGRHFLYVLGGAAVIALGLIGMYDALL